MDAIRSTEMSVNFYQTRWCHIQKAWHRCDILINTGIDSTVYTRRVDRLCGPVVRVPGYRTRRYQIFWEVVDLERGPLSLVSTTEALLDRKVAAPV
jgi:hypothetical protein